jgi:hypothetical protein
MATIGPVAVLPGVPATLGPFSPGVATGFHTLIFDCGAFAGTLLTVVAEISYDNGVTFTNLGQMTVPGPTSVWIGKSGLPTTTIGPGWSQGILADAATRVQFILTADGAFASSGGSYVSV